MILDDAALEELVLQKLRLNIEIDNVYVLIDYVMVIETLPSFIGSLLTNVELKLLPNWMIGMVKLC